MPPCDVGFAAQPTPNVLRAAIGCNMQPTAAPARHLARHLARRMSPARHPTTASPAAVRAAIRPEADAADALAGRALAEDADAFYDALTALLRLYMLRDRDRVCAHGLSVTECYALDALVRLGALTVTGLAAELGVTKSTASRVAAALEGRALVARAPDPADYKATRLAPTTAGRAQSVAITAEVKAEHRALLADFAPPARREATRLLRAVTAAAAPRVRATGSACCDGPSGPERGGATLRDQRRLRTAGVGPRQEPGGQDV